MKLYLSRDLFLLLFCSCLLLSTDLVSQNEYVQKINFTYTVDNKKFKGSVDVNYSLEDKKSKKSFPIKYQKVLEIENNIDSDQAIKISISNLYVNPKHPYAKISLSKTSKTTDPFLKQQQISKNTLTPRSNVPITLIYDIKKSKKKHSGTFIIDLQLIPDAYTRAIPLKNITKQAFGIFISRSVTQHSANSETVAPLEQQKAWDKAIAIDNRTAFEKFLEKYPNNFFKKKCLKKIEAYKKIDEEAWLVAKKSNTVTAYKNYLSNIHAPLHAEEAAALISQITGEDINKILPQIYTDKIKGRLSFVCDTIMEVGKSYIVKMVISSDTTRVFLEEVIASDPILKENKAQVKTEIIKIGKQMRATLRDLDDHGDPQFSIVALEEDKIMYVDLTDGEPTIWTWSVKPLIAGNHRLAFSILIVDIKEGIEINDPEPVKKIMVKVKVADTFWNNNKTAILGFGGISLLSLFGFLFYRRRNRKQMILKKASVIIDPIDKAKFFIEHDQAENAIQTIDQALPDEHEMHNDIVLVKSRIVVLQKAISQSTMKQDEINREKNSIKVGIIDIIDQIRIQK